MVQIENISFRYPHGRHKVFEGTSLTLSKGCVCGLLGKNGTGKSTLLNLMTGLLTPVAGSATIEGDVAWHRKPLMLEKIFLIPENFDLPRISPNAYAALYGRFYPHFSHSEFVQLLTQMEVDGSAKFQNMSFGQRKKSYIAFALACNTEYLFMDEPTNGLDIPSKAVFRRLVAQKASDERTIVISTHQVRDLEELIDHILIIDDRRFLINASVGEITQKLRFARVESGDQPLYAEKTALGEVGVMVNDDPNAETALDIELLFNAVVRERETIKQLFGVHNSNN